MPQNLRQKRIEKDIAWAIPGGLPDKEKAMPLRFLDIFSKINYDREHEKSKIYYLPTIPKSPENSFCKTYLHFLVYTIEVLELQYLLVHAEINRCAPGFYI